MVARPIERLSSLALSTAGWAYLLITALICFDIGARRLLGFSSGATTELTGYLMAVGMSWGLAGTLYERGHVRIDVLVQKLPLRVRVWLHLVALALLTVSSGFFVYGSFSLVRDSFAFGATDLSSFQVPLAIPQGLWAAGLALLLLACVAIGARALRDLAAGQPQRVDEALMARSYVEEAEETLEAVGMAEHGEPGDAATTGAPR